MALAANSIISQNRTLNSLSYPMPKPKLATIHHHPKEPKLNLQFQVQPNNQSHLRTSPTSCVAVQSSDPTSSAATNSWSEFAKNVTGEWDGFGADFTTEGNPIELPENAVPEAYREWEVKVFDWQTQCPTLAQPEDNQVMFYKSIKLLPTVGCEADAATHYSIDVRNIGGVHNKVSAFAYHSTGCYVAFWPTGDYDAFEVEHCLINAQDKESRVRIIQVFRVQEQRITLDKLRVFCEQWYGPFRNGDQLGGCAIRDSGFAATDALKASEVIGVWQGPNAIASFTSSCEDFLLELLGDSVQKSIRDENNLILLPRQLWCSIKESEDGETMCEAGWLFDQGHAISSKCIFSSDAKLKEISLAQETAVSEGV